MKLPDQRLAPIGIARTLPRLPFHAVKPLWFIHFYDGPLSGVCEISDKAYAYAIVDDYFGHRKYTVYTLSDEELQQLVMVHDKFVATVGKHTTFEHGWRRFPRGPVPENWHRFYDNPPVDTVDLNTKTPVAWFSRTPHLTRPRSWSFHAKRLS